MYEISPKHATGIRKKYFQLQREKAPKAVSQVTAFMSYSGYVFKMPRDFVAYLSRLFQQIDKIALYSSEHNTNGNIVKLACISTPASKIKTNTLSGESYEEEFIILEYYVITAKPKNGLCYKVVKLDDHCEVTSHALDRILQRLKTTKLDNVTAELKSSAKALMQIFSCLEHYSSNRLPKRVVVPSNSGAFLCEVNANTRCILYRTFVKSEMYDFQEASVNATRAWLRRMNTNSCSSKDAQDLFTDKANRWWFDDI